MGRFRLRKRVVEAPESDGSFPVPTRFNFTRDVVERAASEEAFRPAMTFVDHEGIIDRRTFSEVANDASRWASYFRSRGLGAGDRVLVFVGKTPVWHSLMLGALKAGLVTVPCSEMLRAGDIDFRVSHSGAKLVVTDSARAQVLEEMAVTVDVVVVDDLASELRTHSVTEATHDTAAEDIAFILYTSGTTKNPKGVVHSHGYTWTARLQAEHWLTARPGDLVWCTAGTGWAKSIWNVLLGPWSCGAEIALHEGGFDAEERFTLIQRLGVTILCQAPTEYRLMAKQPELERYYLGSVRHAVSAGEPLNPEVIEAFQVAFGLTIYDGYGQTENTLLVANVPDVEVKPGSMGLPAPGYDIAVIDDAGKEQAAGLEGEIALRGRPPSLFLRYWDAPEETDAAFRGEWYLTGDRGTRDEDGYLWFTGRADDVILSAAYRIGPFEVESALLEHPSVLESAVVGKPDADRGSLVKAFVVLREGFDPSAELVVELQDHVKAVTAPYKYPREIEFVAELPKTSSGKIRRVVLREEELRAAGIAAPPTSIPTVEEPDLADPVDALADAEEDARRAAAASAALAASEREAAARAAAKEQAAEQARREAVDAEAVRAAEARAREEEQERRALEARRQVEEERRQDEERAAAEAASRRRGPRTRRGTETAGRRCAPPGRGAGRRRGRLCRNGATRPSRPCGEQRSRLGARQPEPGQRGAANP